MDEESGLYYYGARYYDPRISIWASVDPLANYNPFMDDEFYIDGDHNGGLENSFNHSIYSYYYQNPLRLIDPNGKQVDVIDFIPVVGSIRDIIRGVRDGDGTTLAIGIVGLAIDIGTLGGGSGGKGLLKAGVKMALKTESKVLARVAAAQAAKRGGVVFAEGGSKHLLAALAKYEMKISAQSQKVLDKIVNTASSSKWAGKLNKCVEFANDIAKKIGGEIKSIGSNINVGDSGSLGYGDNHYFVEKIVDGKSIIFDNMNPEGLLKSDYMKKIDGFNLKTRRVVSGADLVNGAKTVNKAR
ncbi:RHS repeat-associated core domain-containing protein [Flavobacterium branchiophilum]